MTEETIEQIKARLKRADEEKERAFQKRLKEIDAEQAQWRKEREAAEAAERERREAEFKRRQAEHARAEEEREKEDSRLRWVAAGGTEVAFEKAWPGLWEETLKRRTLEGDNQARVDSARHFIRSF
jgi:hypothetical protein